MGGRGGSSSSNRAQNSGSTWGADEGSIVAGAGGFHFDQAVDTISGAAPFATPQNRVSMQITEDYNLSAHDAGIVDQMRIQYQQAENYLAEANRSNNPTANRDRAQASINNAVDLARTLNLSASDVNNILDTLDRVYISGTGYTSRR